MKSRALDVTRSGIPSATLRLPQSREDAPLVPKQGVDSVEPVFRTIGCHPNVDCPVDPVPQVIGTGGIEARGLPLYSPLRAVPMRRRSGSTIRQHRRRGVARLLDESPGSWAPPVAVGKTFRSSGPLEDVGPAGRVDARPNLEPAPSAEPPAEDADRAATGIRFARADSTFFNGIAPVQQRLIMPDSAHCPRPRRRIVSPAGAS